MAAPMPVVVGAPRSGTTLLRLMLDAHPDLAIPPETGFFIGLAAMLHRERCTRGDFLEFITRFPSDVPAWADYGLEKEAFAAALARIEPFTIADGLRCFYRLYAERHGKPRWGDKTPLQAMHIADIAQLLPEARIVHIIRDGRDAALSLRPLWFAPGKDVASLAAQWQQIVRTARALAPRCPHYCELRYEDLLRNPEREIRSLCEYLELPFHPAMLEYHLRSAERLGEVRDRHRASGELFVSAEKRRTAHRLTSQPPDQSRIGVWRSEMSEQERCEFAAVAGPLLDELGYGA